MRHLFLTIITLSLFISCNKRVVQLPETTNQDITEVIDVSAIYMFYDEENDSVNFNRRNMIGTTNWLVNIDKRLTLKQILTHLQYLQEKRQSDGMHKNDKARNYFTCNNTNLENLSFIEFTNVVYSNDPLGSYLLKMSNLSDSRNIVSIKFKPNNDVTILNPNSKSNVTKTNFKNLKTSLKELDSLENIIYLDFHEDLSFQEYINYKSLFLEPDLKQAKFSNKEFIHN